MDVAHCCLEGNADAAEFCPHLGLEHVLTASTYTLQEGDRPNRAGSISLFDVNGETDSLELFHCIDTSGIFYIKWSPSGTSAGTLLAQANAEGYLKIYGLDCCSDDKLARGSLRNVIDKKVSSSMCLFLDWNPSTTTILVGLSDGSPSIVSFAESRLEILQEWKAHDFELWTTVFDIHQPQLVYTGSDDCKFISWDTRESPSQLVFRNSKTHKMGVCCIAKSPTDPNSVLTGRYDEHLRVFDIRSISKPLNETSVCLGRGVWRIKHHPSISGLILAACMHNGFAIVKIDGEMANIVETYAKHTSLAYGADWQQGKAFHQHTTNKTFVATCSFYDRLLRSITHLLHAINCHLHQRPPRNSNRRTEHLSNSL